MVERPKMSEEEFADFVARRLSWRPTWAEYQAWIKDRRFRRRLTAPPGVRQRREDEDWDETFT